MPDAPVEKVTLLFLAHNLDDPSIARRIRMLQLGGARVIVAGFRRKEFKTLFFENCQTIDFGKTKNGSFIQRILMVLLVLLNLENFKNLFTSSDIILARNLEMLAIAAVAKRKGYCPAPLIYEVLDIHRLLLGNGLVGTILRHLEKYLSRDVKEIFTSSPAFISHYFKKMNMLPLPIRLIENKLLQDGQLPAASHRLRPPGPPWIIGWYGIIRCKKSLVLLAQLVSESKGRIKVVIRGRPAYDQIPDFHEIIERTNGLDFKGPYENPTDLPALYETVHFTWAIDMYEEGLNSSWLLPNRLYEGSYYGAIPLADQNVETGRYLNAHNFGVQVSDPSAQIFYNLFRDLTLKLYQKLFTDIERIPSTQWIHTAEDCMCLVEDMRRYMK